MSRRFEAETAWSECPKLWASSQVADILSLERSASHHQFAHSSFVSSLACWQQRALKVGSSISSWACRFRTRGHILSNAVDTDSEVKRFG